jgi:hypothetical protein
MTNEVELLAKKAESDPFFLGCSLKNYAASERLDDVGLAAKLECTLEALTLLRLCRTPHTDSFKGDLDRIAAKFEVNRDVLGEAARRGQVLLQMRRDAPSDHGLMLAARDDDEPETPESRS